MSDANETLEEIKAQRDVVERLWSQPLLDACDDLLPTPEAATVLVAEVRCGHVPLALVSLVAGDTRIIALEAHDGMLDVARRRAEEQSVGNRIYFVTQSIDDLSYADDVFAAGVCLEGMSSDQQARRGVGELVRVTAGGGKVLMAAPSAASFPEFYDMLDEALRAHQLTDVLPRVDHLRDSLPTPASLAGVSRAGGLRQVRVDTLSWNLSFDSGRDFLHSPLVRTTLFPHWLGVIRSAEREPVFRHVCDAIDTYWHTRPFETSVEAAVVSGVT